MTQALAEVLGRPHPPSRTLRILRKDVGFSDKEIARALNVTDRSVKRWNTGASINTESEEQLLDLARITATLVEAGIPPASVRPWFLYRSAFLEERRPLDAFAEGGFDAVRPALAALADGAYA